MELEKIVEYVAEDLTPSSLLGWTGYFVIWGVIIDIFYNRGNVVYPTILVFREFETTIALIFSGLLVVLYWKQSKVMRENSEIAKRQSMIQSDQVDMMEAQMKPRLRFEDLSLIGDIPSEEIRQSNPYWNHTAILEVKMTNRGEGPAHNLRTRYKFYFMTDKNGYVPFEGFGIRGVGGIFTSNDAGLNHANQTGDGETLLVDETKELISISRLSVFPYSGKAVEKEEQRDGIIDSREIPTVNTQSFGDALAGFYFDVERVGMEIYAEYETNAGNEERVIVSRFDAPIEAVEEIEDFLETGPRLAEFPIADTEKYYEELNFDW